MSSIESYIPVFIQFSLALGIAVAILVASIVFGQRARNSSIKNSPYECGMLSEGRVHPRFSVKFYVTAMLFIIFDIEVVFLLPWALVHRELLAANIPIVLPILFFLLVLTVGLIYELRKGALEWQK
tara:strand:+ start:5546 stop:5923 length:378 start_codon:yes stop_codon:yes gene_type:complete